MIALHLEENEAELLIKLLKKDSGTRHLATSLEIELNREIARSAIDRVLEILTLESATDNASLVAAAYGCTVQEGLALYVALCDVSP